MTAALHTVLRERTGLMSETITEFEGALVQIDYRDDGSIRALHLDGRDRNGLRTELAVHLDPMPEPPELRPGQKHFALLNVAQLLMARVERSVR